MQVRVAVNSDVPTLVGFGASFIKESPNYKDRGFNPKKAANHFKSLINGGGVIFVVEIDGAVIGGFAGGIITDWQSDFKLAFDYVLYVEPDCRKTGAALLLVETFIEWAKGMGAERIQCGTATGVNTEGCVQLYKHMGFKVVGTFLELEV